MDLDVSMLRFFLGLLLIEPGVAQGRTGMALDTLEVERSNVLPCVDNANGRHQNAPFVAMNQHSLLIV